jgi:hypothetical protein
MQMLQVDASVTSTLQGIIKQRLSGVDWLLAINGARVVQSSPSFDPCQGAAAKPTLCPPHCLHLTLCVFDARPHCGPRREATLHIAWPLLHATALLRSWRTSSDECVYTGEDLVHRMQCNAKNSLATPVQLNVNTILKVHSESSERFTILRTEWQL